MLGEDPENLAKDFHGLRRASSTTIQPRNNHRVVYRNSNVGALYEGRPSQQTLVHRPKFFNVDMPGKLRGNRKRLRETPPAAMLEASEAKAKIGREIEG